MTVLVNVIQKSIPVKKVVKVVIGHAKNANMVLELDVLHVQKIATEIFVKKVGVNVLKDSTILMSKSVLNVILLVFSALDQLIMNV